MKKKSFALLFFLIFITLVMPIKTQAHSGIVVVRISSSGFEPQEITVDENTTVNFLNEDTTDHWPASDLHPTHDLYPEFDPKKAIKPQESWLFRANRVGNWRFHDHLFPHLRGTLIITSEKGENILSPSVLPATTTTTVKEKLQTFINQVIIYFFRGLRSVLRLPEPSPSPLPKTDIFKTLSVLEQQKTLEKIATQSGANEAWQYFLTAFTGEAGTNGNIHDLAHFMGATLYKEQGFIGLAQCTPQFAFGCFHGFLDSAFQKDLSKLLEAEKACQTLGPGASGPVASCIHGIGHGVASFYQTKNLTEALIQCKKLSGPLQTYCFDGVFMEFERAAPKSFYKIDNPFYPCDTVEPEHVFSCGRNQTQVLLNRFNKTYFEVAAICTKSKLPDFRKACIDSLGFVATSQSSGDPAKISEACKSFSEVPDRSACIQAAAGELIFQEVPGWEIAAFSLCNELTTTHKTECTAYLDHLIQDYGRPRRKSQNEDINAYIREQMAICYKNGGRDSCYKKVADLFSSQFPLKQTLAVFAQNENHPEIYARCHEATHFLSRNEYSRSKSIPQVYTQCDSTCHGGCYHGALEAYLKETGQSPTSDALKNSLKTICDSVKTEVSPLIFNECMHGLGHAAMFVTEMEIPQSLSLCDAIDDTNGRERCYSGVFMENSSSSTSNDHPGKYVKADDPLYPCNILEEKYLEQCYRYQSSYFALITKHDWLKVANLCQKVPPQYQDSCFRTVGTNQVGFTQDLGRMRDNCYLMPPEFQNTCILGVISSFAYRFVGDVDKMTDFCSQVKPEHQTNCYRQVGTSIADWTTDINEHQNYCQKLGQPDRIQWCQQGTG